MATAVTDLKRTKAMNGLKEQAVRLAALNEQIKQLTEQADEMKSELLESMQAQKVDRFVLDENDERLIGHTWKQLTVAVIKKTMSEVDARAFHGLVPEEEFFASVKVSVTEAKKYLPQRLYSQCITEKAGKPFVQVSTK